MQSLMVRLRERIYNRYDEIKHHGNHELFENRPQNVPPSAVGRRFRGIFVQFLFLSIQERFERYLKLLAHYRDELQPFQGRFYEGLIKCDDDEHFLDVHFDDSFADQRRAEERPERHQEMPACDARQVEKRIWNLQN